MNEPLLPPQNLDAERSVLGGILLDNDRLDDVSGILSQDSFYLHAHKWVFAAIARLRDRKGRKAYDPVTVWDELSRMKKLNELGDDPEAFLTELLRCVPHAAHTLHYAQIVAEKYRRRGLISVGNQAIRDGHMADDLGKALDENASALHRVVEQQAGSTSDVKPLSECLIEFWDRLQQDKPPGISLGFSAVDSKISPRPGNLLIVAARPGMGKTAFVGNVAINVSRDTGPVGFLSLEQSRDEITDRIVSAQTGIPLYAILHNRLTDDDRTKILEFSGTLSELPFHIDDGGKNLSQVISTLRFLRRTRGISLAIIDYLQIIDPDDRRQPREQQISTATRALKHLAKDLQIPIIALSQLNREVEKRNDKRPQLSDLRESGAIEQDADIVAFIHRPEAYDPDDNPGKAEVIIAKHRSGEKGIATLEWDGATTCFKELASNGWYTPGASE